MDKPVLASTHPEWIASSFLDAPTFPLAATRFLSYLAPRALQAAYGAMEPALDAFSPAMQAAGASVPAVALPLVVVAADAVFALGALAYALAAPLGVMGVAYALGAARK